MIRNIERYAVDPSMTFNERKRERYMRRAKRHSDDEVREVIQWAVGLIAALGIPLALCWTYSLSYCAALL